jgi:hypothetical protein
LDP